MLRPSQIVEVPPLRGRFQRPSLGRVPVLPALALASLLGTLALSKALLSDDAFPTAWHIPVGEAIADAADWFVENCRWLYEPTGNAAEGAFDELLYWMEVLPAPVLSFAIVVLVLCTGGRALAVLSALTVAWVVSVGLWDASKETLALMTVAVAWACLIGIAVGVVCALNRATRTIVTVVLDGMQAVPVFVYLLPVVLVFGPGNAAALLVTVVYALPPAVRLTELGIRGVPSETVETAVAFGSTRRQTLTRVQLPLARSSIMAGVNQTIMFAMAMSIIAAMIGAAGLGQPVWRSLSRLEFGQALEGGIALVLMAIVMDRVSGRLGNARASRRPTAELDGYTRDRVLERFLRNHRNGLIGVAVVIGFAFTVEAIPSLRLADFGNPAGSLQVSLGGTVDSAVDWLNVHLAFLLDPMGDAIVLYALNPLTDVLSWLPWPAVVLAAFLVGCLARGWRAGVLQAGCIVLIGLLGTWDAAIVTMSIVGASVFIAVLLGIPLGIAMSASDRFAAVLRPVLDVMQTLPIFLFVIPTVVILGVGPVAGVLATVIYASPPVIRLTNLALRNVDRETVEAATSFGSTSWQTLRHVRVPMGFQTIMAGVNQTIMLALAMSVVAAFIGAPGLGATILVSLTEVDLATGFEAGLSMLVLAVAIDRLITGLASRLRSAEHLAPR